MIFGFIKISYVVLYVLIINCIGIGAMALDKFKAERARWRIPEKTLFMIAFLGGRNWHNAWYVLI